MRTPVATQSSVTSHPGGYFSQVSGTAIIEGSPIVLNGDIHCCPNCPNRPHDDTIQQDPTADTQPVEPVYSPVSATGRARHHGKALARVGDVVGCGAVIMSGASRAMVS